MLPLPVHGEACSLPTRTFGAVRSSDPNSGPVSQGGGGHVAAPHFADRETEAQRGLDFVQGHRC